MQRQKNFTSICSSTNKRNFLVCQCSSAIVTLWNGDDVPSSTPPVYGDLQNCPGGRVFPLHSEDELERLMVAFALWSVLINEAALLAARWSGQEREEIQRLSIDCLDRYQDGTPRLPIPSLPGRQCESVSFP